MSQPSRVIQSGARALFIILSLGLMVLGAAAPLSAQESEVLIVEAKGPVTPAMASYFGRAIGAAEESGAEAVAVVLDTPGGSLDITLDIVQLFRNADVPVIVFVGPAGAQAASAGSVVTVAAHASAMAPETVMGAASPVGGSGEDIGETLYQKITEDLKATMRNHTERRGEEAVALAESMIDEAKAVTANEALEAGLIDVIASDVPDLLQQLDGRPVVVNEREIVLQIAGASPREFSMTAVEQMLHALSNPLLIGLLLTIGVQAILIEISSPGGWVAGFIGVVSLAMALYGLGTLPTNWLGLGLIAVAFVLLILEVKTPATGALAVVGAITLLAGLLLLFNSPGSPDFARISIPGAVAIAVFTVGFFVFLVTKALRAQRERPVTGIEGMIGEVGPVRADFRTSASKGEDFNGTVLVKGELWRATSDEAIARGDQVMVKSVDGFTLRVKKVG